MVYFGQSGLVLQLLGLLLLLMGKTSVPLLTHTTQTPILFIYFSFALLFLSCITWVSKSICRTHCLYRPLSNALSPANLPRHRKLFLITVSNDLLMDTVKSVTSCAYIHKLSAPKLRILSPATRALPAYRYVKLHADAYESNA